MNISAVIDQPTDIQAAVAGLPPNIKRLAASADVTIAGRISVAAIDAKLSASRLTTIEKLQLKIGLNRSGLLFD
jgi:hypothetical protein